MVKRIIVLGVVVVALMAAGVIHFQRDGDEVNISIDKGRFKQVTGKLIGEGKNLVNEARDEFDERYEASEEWADEAESNHNRQSRRFTPSRNR